ncbi:ATP-binding protein [Anaerohalosphaera lusitana]|nr:ATP-binding protein [Anaerohalosphaera lusitana]
MRAKNTALWNEQAGPIMEAFFSHTLEPMAILDAEFNFIRVNDAYAKIASRESDDFIGENHFDLYPHEENERIFRSVVDNKKPYLALAKPFEHPDQPERGTTYWNWKLFPILDYKGAIKYLVFTLEDVTAETRAKERLKEANEKLEKRARQLQKMSAALSAAEDRERERLSEVLHDDLQQRLVAAKFQINIAASRSNMNEDVAEQLEEAGKLLDGAIKKSRNLSHELCPPVLSQYGLGAAFEWLAVEMGDLYDLTLEVIIGTEAEPDTEEIRSFAFKSVRELVFNAVKHAGVDRVRVNMQRSGEQIQIIVSDEGKGFDVDSVLGGANKGFGLLSMRERLDVLGGSLLIKSSAGEGSEFVICLPGEESNETEREAVS